MSTENTNPTPIRIVIADDFPMTRAGLRSAIEQASGLEIMGEAKDGEEALQMTHTLKPDVLLLDIEMPKRSGVEVAEELRRTNTPVRVLALSAYDDREYIYGLLDNGAAGYLMKHEADTDLITEAIKGIMHEDREPWISPRLARKLVRCYIQSNGHAGVDLTEREMDVLKRVAHGYSNQQIATTLNLSSHTIKNHVHNIRGKIDVGTRAELVAWAWHRGIVTTDDGIPPPHAQ